MTWLRNPAPLQLLPSIAALMEELFSNQVCAHHLLPKSPEAVSACLGEDRPKDFALPALGDAQAHAVFDRIQRCFSVGNKHSSDSKYQQERVPRALPRAVSSYPSAYKMTSNSNGRDIAPLKS